MEEDYITVLSRSATKILIIKNHSNKISTIGRDVSLQHSHNDNFFQLCPLRRKILVKFFIPYTCSLIASGITRINRE